MSEQGAHGNGQAGAGDDRADNARPGDTASGAQRKPSSVPDIEQALRDLRSTGKATLGAGRHAATALRILVSADISLARSAFGRTLALTGVAIAFGASAWLLLMAALITFLSRHTGLSWTWSLLLTAGLSASVTGLSIWLSLRYFEHTRLQATRRQLARLGVGELAGLMADAATPGSTDEAADNLAAANEVKPVKKDLGVDITPP